MSNAARLKGLEVWQKQKAAQAAAIASALKANDKKITKFTDSDDEAEAEVTWRRGLFKS